MMEVERREAGDCAHCGQEALLRYYKLFPQFEIVTKMKGARNMQCVMSVL